MRELSFSDEGMSLQPEKPPDLSGSGASLVSQRRWSSTGVSDLRGRPREATVRADYATDDTDMPTVTCLTCGGLLARTETEEPTVIRSQCEHCGERYRLDIEPGCKDKLIREWDGAWAFEWLRITGDR